MIFDFHFFLLQGDMLCDSGIGRISQDNLNKMLIDEFYDSCQLPNSHFALYKKHYVDFLNSFVTKAEQLELLAQFCLRLMTIYDGVDFMLTIRPEFLVCKMLGVAMENNILAKSEDVEKFETLCNDNIALYRVCFKIRYFVMKYKFHTFQYVHQVDWLNE